MHIHVYACVCARGALNPNMPIEIVLSVVFDVMLVRSPHWTLAQMGSAACLALNIMDALSKRLDRQRIFDNASAEENAMNTILAARLAAEANAVLAAERAGMTWSEWPPDEPWDAGFYGLYTIHRHITQVPYLITGVFCYYITF